MQKTFSLTRLVLTSCLIVLCSISTACTSQRYLPVKTTKPPLPPIPAYLKEPKHVDFLDNYEAHLNSMGVKPVGQTKTPDS